MENHGRYPGPRSLLYRLEETWQSKCIHWLSRPAGREGAPLRRGPPVPGPPQRGPGPRGGRRVRHEPPAAVQRRAGSAGSRPAGPHFSGGGCHGPTAAPLPPGWRAWKAKECTCSARSPPSDKGDFVGRDNGPIALVSGNREQRKVYSTFLGTHQRALDLPLFPVP